VGRITPSLFLLYHLLRSLSSSGAILRHKRVGSDLVHCRRVSGVRTIACVRRDTAVLHRSILLNCATGRPLETILANEQIDQTLAVNRKALLYSHTERFLARDAISDTTWNRYSMNGDAKIVTTAINSGPAGKLGAEPTIVFGEVEQHRRSRCRVPWCPFANGVHPCRDGVRHWQLRRPKLYASYAGVLRKLPLTAVSQPFGEPTLR